MPPRPAPRHTLLRIGTTSSNVEPTPAKLIALADASPLTTEGTGMVHQGNTSPVDTISDSLVRASPVKQTPPKAEPTVLPKNYDPTTGWTPGANINAWRAEEV